MRLTHMKPPIQMAEERATAEIIAESLLSSTEENAHPIPQEVSRVDSIDILFGCLDIPRTTHVYEDGVTVEILNLANDDVSSDKSYNGSRVFYQRQEDGRKTVLCRFPGYTIDKFVVDSSRTEEGIEQVLSRIEQVGSLCLTNDGPLLLIFKINGKVRIHMMRSAGHGFEEQFAADYAEQYGGTFNDLFDASVLTSSICHIFRQGLRSSAMRPPVDSEGRTLLYMGHLLCATEDDSSLEEESLLLQPSSLSRQDAFDVLQNTELGLVCFRHAGGEVQLMADSYLRRVAVLTGVSMDEMITGSESSSESFSSKPEALQVEPSAKLCSSRFPRLLDLLSLYILCGTNSSRKKMATVSGFISRIDAGGRILATPKRGFYNYCRVAGVHPRREIPFPATPSSMRLAIRRIVLNSTLSSNSLQVERQFDNYEMALFQLTPQLVARVLTGSASLSDAFHSAFGITAFDLTCNMPLSTARPSRAALPLKSIRSALLLSDPYRLVTISRFALRHLIDAEFTPAVMRESQLIGMLSEYSISSRRRRLVAESVAVANLDLSNTEEWPPLALTA